MTTAIPDIPTEVEQIKKELVELIIKHLRENKIDVEKSRKLAADFLGMLPINDQKDLLAKLKTLSEEYEEAKEIYVKELVKVNEVEREETLNKMRDAIKQGKIEAAIAVAKALYQQ